jgi:SUN family beta-glucosidase
LNALETLVEEIVTAVSGESCTDGAMCSYQCPDGYLKAQWPTAQGSTGQSVGGINCTDGKLYRTNADYETLCVAGVQALSVQNTLSESVCFCRTDYPGKFGLFVTFPLHA